MLNIVIVCGGTGSISLQKGFDNLYNIKNYNIDIVINAYDDGKSTGACRRVFKNEILGSSDLRKNQLTLFESIYKEKINDSKSYEAKLFQLFNLRFSADGYEDYYVKSCSYVENSEFLNEDIKEKFIAWIRYFFYECYNEKKIRESVYDVQFKDFSLSNIFYSSSAAMQGNSLSKAGIEMAKILGIKNNVHLISDVSLLLKARTNSGYIIEHEGDIVSWDNPDDKIEKVILCKSDGEEYIPSVDEQNSSCVQGIFFNADLIIFSSGTQWSSLIPTYMHSGFNEMICHSKAKKYLIMNNIEDHDMYGVSADGILEIIEKYLSLEDITVVLNDNAVDSMRTISCSFNFIHSELSALGDKRHIPEKIVKLVMKNYYDLRKEYNLISDLDGTLWDGEENGDIKSIGKENLELFEGIILSGNSYEHVAEVTSRYFYNKLNNAIYCDYGNVYFFLDALPNKQIVSNNYLIEDNVIYELRNYDEFKMKMTLRGGGCILTIKPLDNRDIKLRIIKDILNKYGSKYEGRIAGRTSIDIVRKGFNKAAMLDLIILKQELCRNDLFYIGNELQEGNEVCIKNTGIKTLQVNDVFETNIFLKTYLL